MSKQFLVYLTGGVICAVLDIGIMQGLIWFELNYILATTAGFFLSFLVNYIFHANLTFKSITTPTSFIKFSAVVCINYAITLSFVFIAYTFFNYALVGKIISLPVIAINGFFLGKLWVFK
ncbi:GtrA family protein [Undibacterium sp. RTI2.1]|uniref:GtrA family protein n=1 Tax=unclassified Undibacterium TaxID=2630295 RepID=UPI002AB5A0AD|nr:MULTISPECIES: GtrA family protein [unclassified Undibacterium]MDY7539960.1 GtrA family protein [Undibacterium sp. 5I1]MEB0032817.1 GtrA family protein [Undibacterium sp. RTI2.1]MEB0116471.1 GtrA family protein [Undibacterium sp. RTI2.2]MEB0257265.1 GtrA family protein [Undibacterium sp. 5I1]